MTPRSRSSRVLRTLALLFAFVVTACGGDDSISEPSTDISFLVGVWEAVALTVTEVGGSSRTADLVEMGSSFRIDVQPSGQYTATLTFLGFPSTEIGRLEIDGNELVFFREFPNEVVSRADFERAGNRIILVGDTEFDFDLDGNSVPSRLRTELEPRPAS